MTIEEQVRAAHPKFVVREDKQDRVISPETEPETYEAMIAERVVWETERQAAAAEESAERTKRQQVSAALIQLDEDATKFLADTGTAAEVRRSVGRLCRNQAALIRILVRRGLIERD